MNVFSNQRVELFNEYNWFYDVNFARWIIEHLVEYGDSLCDVGSGTGYMLNYYKDCFKDIQAIEPNGEMFKILKANYSQYSHIKLTNISCEKMNINEKYDIVISKSSLHHFENVDNSLEKMYISSINAFVIIEVIAVNDKCIPFLQNILLRKERQRNINTIFTEEKLINNIKKYTNTYRSLHYDQYLNINKWLKNSDLNENEQNNIYHDIVSQPKEIIELMQIHSHNNELYMIRRMNMVIGVKKC